jgi:RimJ/RimL family protein N-acetyltransferase
MMTEDSLRPTIRTVDDRIRADVEGYLGLPLASFPTTGIEIRESSKRKEEPGQRMQIVRIDDGAVATGTTRILALITPVLGTMSIWELFSPLGMAEVSRVLPAEDRRTLFQDFVYYLTGAEDFRAATGAHVPAPRTKADIPSPELELRISQRRSPSEAEGEFVWAFVCRQGEEEASCAVIMWHTPDVADIGVETGEKYRRRGYGLACVSAAAQYILEQGGVATYSARVSNIPSLRIARRLGFTLTYQAIGA